MELLCLGKWGINISPTGWVIENLGMTNRVLVAKQDIYAAKNAKQDIHFKILILSYQIYICRLNLVELLQNVYDSIESSHLSIKLRPTF